MSRKKTRRAAGASPESPVTQVARPTERAAVDSGDLQGLSDVPESNSESIRELVDEGQAFEAEVIEGVENAWLATPRRKVKTREVPEDDVPREYTDAPSDEPKE